MANGTSHIAGFDTMIKKSFGELIEKFGFNFIDYSDNDIDDYRLVGANCILRFNFDRGDLSCLIINSQMKSVFHVDQVYKALYPNDNSYPYSNNIAYELQIERFAQIIENRLMNVMEGDFSWVNKIKN